MKQFSEKAAARELSHFDAVWARVDSSRSAKKLTESAGVPLMPRKQCRCRPNNSCRGR